MIYSLENGPYMMELNENYIYIDIFYHFYIHLFNIIIENLGCPNVSFFM